MKSGNILILLSYVSVFLIGAIVTGSLFYIGGNGGILTGNVISDADAPSNRITEDNVVILDDKIIIRIDNASISRYLDTGSMKPFFDEGSNGIQIVPQDFDEINVGDIISFNKNDMLIVHRVVEKGIDDEGVYFITQGDSQVVNDGKVRFSDIKYITVGVLY